MSTLSKETITEYFKSLQDSICNALEETDGKAFFEEDAWQREGGGGGRTRVIANGAIIEKGAVNFSAVHGKTPEKILQALNLEESDFYATGVSIVLHPANPLVPIIHMNVRYFEMTNGVHWFGGGIDLTPHYVVKSDAKWFHEQLKNACDLHDKAYYPKLKNWADDYFFSKHRNETRGVGGIFFDHLKPDENHTKEANFAFVQQIGNTFAPIYTHFMRENSKLTFTEAQQEWQYLRRSRYVEFNLLWDKGTKFGLDTDGRTESIMVSMPPMAKWVYNYQAKEGSDEEKTLSLLKKGIDWVK
jgi:coproporphyrinogen III oxidase